MSQITINTVVPETQEERNSIVGEMLKIDWDAFFMYRAFCIAVQSPDAQTKQGIILVDTQSHRVISEGFNGFPAGLDDSNLPRHRPDKYKWMIHCEPNAWNWAARIGAQFDDVTAYCTMTACETCARNHITASSNLKIKKLIYWEDREFQSKEIFRLYPEIVVEQFKGGIERILKSGAATLPLQYMACTPQTGRLDAGWTTTYSEINGDNS